MGEFKISRQKSAYNLFIAENSNKLVEDALAKDGKEKLEKGERMRIAAAAWKSLTEDKKKKYTEQAKKEKAEHDKVTAAFKDHGDWDKVPEKWKTKATKKRA